MSDSKMKAATNLFLGPFANHVIPAVSGVTVLRHVVKYLDE